MTRTPVTISDVAAHAGVSRATVSYALTQPDRLSARMLERVRGAIDELGYVRNDLARQLRVGQCPSVGMIVSNAANPNFSELAEGAEVEAARSGRFLMLVNSREDRARERDYIGFFESQQVSGILIAPIDEVPPELIDLRKRGTPFVLVGVEPGVHDYPSISGDNELGGYLAATHLIAQGRDRLAFVGGPHHHVNYRYEGAVRAVGETAGRVSLEVIRVSHQTAQAGGAVARQLLDRPRERFPDGIFAGNDLLALGVLHSLITDGIRVPEDVSLIGYDDIEFAGLAIVPLSTIRHPSAALGASAVQLLLGTRAPGEVTSVDPHFAPRLVVRRTSLPDFESAG